MGFLSEAIVEHLEFVQRALPLLQSMSEARLGSKQGRAANMPTTNEHIRLWGFPMWGNGVCHV